jgi:hypothetical protein
MCGRFEAPRLKAPLVTDLVLVVLPCDVALPVVVDATSGHLYLSSWAPAITDCCAYKFVGVIGFGKDGLEMTGLLRIGRPEISYPGS